MFHSFFRRNQALLNDNVFLKAKILLDKTKLLDFPIRSPIFCAFVRKQSDVCLNFNDFLQMPYFRPTATRFVLPLGLITLSIDSILCVSIIWGTFDVSQPANIVKLCIELLLHYLDLN